ncbi:MAG: hypothetical protein GX989_08600 [Firmicutes bacterium]|nr:hypothetical protein [Bacillota bacterium]
MDNLILGLEISVIGFSVTIATLLLLAGILLIFNSALKEKKEGQGGGTALQEIEPQKKHAAESRVEISPASKALRPEIVAAAIGAINYTLEKQASSYSVIAKIQSMDEPNNFWAQAGRTRVVNLRQDFVSHKRGKLR